jgi:hypothetical protein
MENINQLNVPLLKLMSGGGATDSITKKYANDPTTIHYSGTVVLMGNDCPKAKVNSPLDFRSGMQENFGMATKATCM